MFPKVSILIPTFNRAHYLFQSIESALAQDYPDLEVVVSDNASTDETESVIKRFSSDGRFKYFKNDKNIGMVKNWRKALVDYITGDWFLILSDDDYLINSEYISNAMKIIVSNKDIVIVYGYGYILNEDLNKMTELILPFNDIEEGKIIFLKRGEVSPQDFILCNVLFNRKIALTLNSFSNEYNLVCDSELFLKMCLYGKIGIIKEFVSVYRVHSSNLLKTQLSDINILKNKPEYLLQAYNFAIQTGLFSKDELIKWRDRLILPEIKNSLIDIFLFFKKDFKDSLEFYKEKNEDLLLKVTNDYKFKKRILIGRFSRSLLLFMRGFKKRHNLKKFKV